MKIENQSRITNHDSLATHHDSVWRSLETSSGLTAVPVNWRRHMNRQFEIFKSALLQKEPKLSKGYPCGHCACTHEVIDQTPEALAELRITKPSPSPHPMGRGIEGERNLQPSTCNLEPDFVAMCRCDPPTCQHDHLPLSRADVELWSLNWSKLARALCHAFGLNYQFADLKIYNTHQIGSWSADAVPVILTIQTQRGFFHSVITELIARLRQKFILLAPTGKHFDANCQELLANGNAAFFPIDSNIILTQNGNLHSVKIPGELFAKFTPQPKEVEAENFAGQLFALAKMLDAEAGMRKAPPSTVLRLYCVEELEPDQIAKKLHCARSLIYSRLDSLRQKLGRDPSELRRYSSHLERIESSLTDPRAKHIHRMTAAEVDGDPDEPEN
jgi:hypothetical protein